MYDFLFWIYYEYNNNRHNDDSVSVPSLMLGVSVIIQILFLLSICEGIFHFRTQFTPSDFHSGQRKLIYLPIVIGVALLVYLIYRKRSKKVLERYSTANVSKNKRLLFFMLAVVLPLAIGLILRAKYTS